MGESSTAASKFPANNTDIPDDSRGEDTRPRGLPRPEEKPTSPPLKRSSTSFSTSVIRNYGDSRERLRAAEWVQTRRSTSSLSRVRAPTTRVCSNAAKIRAAYLSRGHPHLRLKTDLGFASSRSMIHDSFAVKGVEALFSPRSGFDEDLKLCIKQISRDFLVYIIIFW